VDDTDGIMIQKKEIRGTTLLVQVDITCTRCHELINMMRRLL